MNDLLFVYGTLRPAAPGPGTVVRDRLGRGADHLGRGRVRGRLYRVTWYPALRPAEAAAEIVIGDVFRLPADSSGLLKELDAYEGAQPDDPEADYRRVKTAVTLDAGGEVQAWTYVYARPLDEAARIASGDFLAPAAP